MSGLISPVRKDFPLFHRREGEPGVVYLDSGATTQKPEKVIRRISSYYRRENANIHRGCYPLGIQADRSYEKSREVLRRWLGAEKREEIVFTKGSTESLNLLAHTALTAWGKPGDNVVVTELEHSSNFYPFREQCRLRGMEFRVAPAGADGTLDLEEVKKRTDTRTRLISITAMSNVTGFRPELAPLIQYAHKKGARVVVDASQEAAHHRVNVRELDCDFLCFSGHKVYGPMGCGVLYGKAELLEQLPPFLVGGDMLEWVGKGEVCWKAPSGRFEAGTPNLEAIVGLAAAIEYLKKAGPSTLLAHEERLSEALFALLRGIPGLKLYGSGEPSPIAVFNMEGYGAYDVGAYLGMAGICIRCGAHCAYPLMARMGLENCCRVSLGIYNDGTDLDALAERLKRLRR